jgi:pilus assembly protein Flp/PilA
MKKIFAKFKSLPSIKKDQDGASLVEYALLVALISVAAIVAMKFLGTSISSQLNYVGGQVSG